MSDTEKLWSTIAVMVGDDRKWSDLNQQQQQVWIQGINCFLAVLNKMV